VEKVKISLQLRDVFLMLSNPPIYLLSRYKRYPVFLINFPAPPGGVSFLTPVGYSGDVDPLLRSY